jgi:hypothetical protein
LPIDPGFPEGTIIEHSNRVVKDTTDGTHRVEPEVIGSPEFIDQYQSGYRCLVCHGVQDEPFPKVCKHRDVTDPDGWKCGYEMRARQAADFAATRGEGYWGPTPLDALDDERERENWKPATSILLPGKDF